jgi:ERCC4-type nuclease
MIIEVDYREKHLLELFEINQIQIYIKNLDIGDIIIKDDSNNIKYIIERKTIDDLCCSILDGRYREQKQRILSNINSENVIYIIEGDNKVYNKAITYKTVMSSIISITLRDKITVLRTKTLEETYINIMLIVEKLDNKKLEQQNNSIESNIIKTKKKDNMDENMYYIAVLSQIPGCSINAAKKIKEHVSSIVKLYELYTNNETDIVKNIVVGKKKIGEKLTNRIFSYLFYNN